ncbi:glycosyltransferase [Empedobacter sp. UBA5637]|uniref:glycosyltransferase n=1 Tax=Empedobacter sp. UBA5637 TaxID=1946442 RepID=UPI0025C2AEFA|nr:glycosyltransferase [Empedobacter sp. UBA5637]
MKPKILFTASVPRHIRAFHLPYLKWFQDQGYETHVACNEVENLPYIYKFWKVDFSRNPFSYENIKAYNQLKKIIDSENYVLINCHTPAASVVTRLAAKKARKKGTKLLYTAHGFHFYKGAPKIYWALFYPIELFLSHYTDAIITINQEDFSRIKDNGSSKTDYYLIPGIGVNNERFFPMNTTEKIELRQQLNFDINKKILIYAAEFIDRKNHQFIINAVFQNKSFFKDKLILFAGKGILESALKKNVIENKLEDVIQFIGYRKDIDKIFQLADVGISSSKQEGLPINMVEAMMCGLPIVSSKVRGHVDLINNTIDGFLFEQENYSQFIHVIEEVLDSNKYEQLKIHALEKSKKFELSNSLFEMSKIYKKYL